MESSQFSAEEVERRFADLGLEKRPYPPISPSNQTSRSISPAATIPEGLILHVDPKYDPNKTPEEPTTTEIVGERTQEEQEALRFEDDNFCKRHFDGRVVRSSVGEILRRLGGVGMSMSWEILTEMAKTKLKGKQSKVNKLMGCVAAESKKSYDLNLVYVDGIYWMNALASYASQPDLFSNATHSSVSPPPTFLHTPSQRSLSYFPTPTKCLPKTSTYKKGRKFNAALRPSSASTSTITNILVNVGITQVDPPNFDFNPLIGSDDKVAKFQQTITNAHDVFSQQPTRLSVPSLSFHGKGKETDLVFSILTPERLEIAIIERIFDPSTLPSIAALLKLLQVSPLFQLGFNPLIEYSLDYTDHGFSQGDVVPTQIIIPASSEFESPTKVAITPRNLSPDRTDPFGRSTVVYPGPGVTIKLAHISNKRAWKERTIVEVFSPDPPPYVPRLIDSIAFQTDFYEDEYISTLKKKMSQMGTKHPTHTLLLRHLEAMVFAVPLETATRLHQVKSASIFLSSAKQLFQSILSTFKTYGLIHRDISTGNVLVAGSQLQLIDWELGRIYAAPLEDGGRTVTGTLDTMSIQTLQTPQQIDLGFPPRKPLPQEDLESSFYVVLKALCLKFRPEPYLKTPWLKAVKGLYWDTDVDAPTLALVRKGMWSYDAQDGSHMSGISRVFERFPAQATLVQKLFSLPVSITSPQLIGMDDQAIGASLEDLVAKAVQIIDETDPAGMYWE